MSAEEDDSWKKLPLDERSVHKLWKARVNGYEEITKLFGQIDDEKSPEFAKFAGLIKKFVVDSNALAQEKGLEATLAYVENYAHAGKTAGDVVAGIVAKCIAAPKTRTRDLALQVILMYIEIEKQESVQEELLKGTELKNPKIVAACISAITTGLKEFGAKVVNVKPLIKKISALFSERDKGIRDEARLMVIEIYRWIGPALKSQLSNLQPVQITELEVEFAKVEGKVVPTRYLRSQVKQAKIAAETADAEDEEDDEADTAVAIDPYDLADPVNILSKLPNDFYEKIEAKKWQERKEILETLERLVKAPKLENGDYGDLVRALKKVIQKDSNVVVIALAGKCLADLANALKKRFQPYAVACISALLEKFKEKKQNVVSAIREAVDAVYLATTLEAIVEDVLEALGNKNPSVKSETSLFLARSFTKTQPAALNKKLLKAYTTVLIKNINEPDLTVRESSSEALGTLMKLVGEKAVGPFLVEIEKDNLKMTRIKEFCDKAVITVKISAVKKERPTTAPAKIVAPADKSEKSSSSAPASRPVKRPTTAKKKTAVILSGTATIVKSRSSKAIAEKPREREMCEDEAAEIVGGVLKPETLTGLTDANWKTRLTAMTDFIQQLQENEIADISGQAFVKVLNKKPGLKDTNFQVLKIRFDAVKYIAETCSFSTTAADLCVVDITEKLGDPKNGSAAGDALTAIAERTKLDHVATLAIEFALTQKSPKVLQEAIMWLSTAIKEFGILNLNVKGLIDSSKKALASTNPAVRIAAISLLGTLYLYMGPQLNMFFENEKSALRDLITAEFEKYENEKPPVPTRGIMKSTSANTFDQDDEEESGGGDTPVINVQDLLPRIDISSQVTESLLDELADKNWKVRNEALIRVSGIISDSKLIKPNIGDLPQALALRLVDSNSKIAQTALNICENIASAMGPPCKQYVRVLLPGFLQGLGDSKAWIRSASINCMNVYGEQCSFKELFEGEMIGDALKNGSPTLRSELWTWLAEKLPKIKSVPKEELMVCIPYLYTNLEDRNADVRKNAQEAVLGIMIHLSYESMAKQTEKLKVGSKTVVMAALDKARPNLPAKPKAKQPSAIEAKEEKVIKNVKSLPTVKTSSKTKTNAGVVVAKAVSGRKKEEECDTSPLLVKSNMKHQRTIDESKLKVLRWNFTTPREEFVELLREQMGQANVNKTLMGNMFHSDFKNHIKAIDALMEDLSGNSAALISNLDLILKWVTLRFFDTNPSVLLRALEYLHSVFNMLIENKYHMLENEASSFIPYLVLKAGDPKDAVRNGVRCLFKQISNVYAVSKLFSYVMEGLKSKNARQRTECLECMGSVIEDYGINVCLPTPAACLKEVAKQISDRDNAVRNAALNCVVQAYFIVGEKVFKMVGQISDKDMSLLEERIKRAKRPVPKASRMEPATMVLNTSTSPQREHNISVHRTAELNGQDDDDGEEEYVEEDDIPGIALPSQVPQESLEYTGPFRLDPEFMKELESVKPFIAKLDLQEFDLNFLKEAIVVPSVTDARATIMPLSPPKPILPNQTFSRTSLGQRQSSPRVGQNVMLEKTITQMGSEDLDVAQQAIEQMQEILQSNKGNLIIDYEEQFMRAVVTQLMLLQSHNPQTDTTACKVYRNLLTVMDAFYANKILGRKVPIDVLKDLLNQLILLLVEERLGHCENGDTYNRIVNVHCVKIIERSNHSHITCALVKLFRECVRNEGVVRRTDLVMKCLWRLIKIMPNWGEEIDYDSVLYEIHGFFKEFPSSWWKNKPADTPLRTVKTILHSMAKVKGGQLMLHLGKIPNTNDSELEAYVLRLLKTLKLEEVKQVPLKTEKTDTRRSLSRSVHTTLTDIFQKIGNKEDTKEGLNLLYDFLQQHPEADIEPFLKRSSKFFQNYINTGLKQIEEARNAPAGEVENIISLPIEPTGDSENRGSEYWRERLKMWNRMWDEAVGNPPQNE